MIWPAEEARAAGGAGGFGAYTSGGDGGDIGQSGGSPTGAGFLPVPGGNGGTAPSGNGGNGTNGSNLGFGNTGGSGGGGGANGSLGSPTGGNGGNGANGNPGGLSDGGGGGGAGGDAVITSTSISNSAAIQGGNGGNGGAGAAGNSTAANGGGGGDGGAGIIASSPGLTIINGSGSSITGGKGGAAGAGSTGGPSQTGSAGAAGAGGTGIIGSDLTIINSGAITGGVANGGAGARANAITFTGGSNSLELQGGSIITGNVVGTGSDTLRLGGTTDSAFDISAIGAATQYQGFGIFQKIGSSTWTLTGTNAAVLPWSVSGGTLLVNGSIPNSPMTVYAGGTLGGNGIVGNTAIAGGTLAPGGAGGSAFGPLTVQGSLSFTAASTYMIQVSPANAGRTNVTGTATLGGGTVSAVFQPGTYVNRQYTILTASGGVGGTFNPAVTSNNPNVSTTLSYDANDVFLNVKLNFVAPGGNLSVNQQNLANAIVNFFNSNGGIPLVYSALTAAGLTQASGESATGSQQTTFNAMSQFMGLLTDPFMNRTGGANPAPGASGYADEGQASAYAANKKTDAFAMFTKAPPTFEQRWSVWAAGYGGSQSTDGNAALGSNNATSSIAGTAVGADYLFSPNTIAGFALAGGGTSFSVANGGTGRSDLFQAGAYVRHTNGPIYVSAALAYGWQDITTDRTLMIAGLDHLRAEFNANAYSGRVEGGYRFVAPWTGGIGIAPYAATQFVTFDLPAYAEQAIVGSSNFALAYGAKDVTDVRTELGFRTDKSFAMADGILTLRGRVAWAHDYDPDRSIAATFQALPGASFVVNGAAQAADSALTTASIERKWMNGWSAAATFEGEFSNVTASYAGKGVVRYAW